MKIGILTYHRSHNYGALLQATALHHYLSKLGHEVYFIDYWPAYHKQMYDLFSLNQALHGSRYSFFIYPAKFIIFFKKRKKRIELFTKFINKYIAPYCSEYSNKDKYDLIVYGSDQIWRKQSGLGNRFNPVYFADNILCSSKHISYAASMGSVKFEEEDYDFLKKRLKNFYQISVREDSLKECINKIGFNSEVVVDPTLLLSGTTWNNLFSIQRLYSEKYILYYRLLRNSFNEKHVIKFAASLGYKLIILDGAVRVSKANVISAAGPLEFLSLIKYSEFVLTSSYHGLVFSLIFNKNFFASFAENQDRAESLLMKLGLENRLLTPETDIPLDLVPISYKEVNEKIDSLRFSSADYIIKNFNY